MLVSRSVAGWGRRGIITGCDASNMAFDEPQQCRALGLPSGKDNSPHPFGLRGGV